MDTYILIIFIWVVGWLYACGVHSGNSDKLKDIEVKNIAAYAVLFFVWPHYLGYGK